MSTDTAPPTGERYPLKQYSLSLEFISPTGNTPSLNLEPTELGKDRINPSLYPWHFLSIREWESHHGYNLIYLMQFQKHVKR